jgi:acetylornithine deacetylase/succinyl-diaminopimelate desuccinylase-like protein
MTAVELLQELLRIDTTNPPGRNEGVAAQVLETHLGKAGLETELFTSSEDRVSLIARLPGPHDAPALVLLSHLDVVPVEEEHWTHDPFGGEIDKGAIWGRGSLDMKGIAVMHAEAVRALAEAGEQKREVIVCAVADEETGGSKGAEWLLENHSGKLGFGDGRPAPEVIGEGAFGLSGIVDRPLMPVVVGEKSMMRIEVTATGDPGHGSLPPARMATKNLSWFIDKVAGHRPPRVHPVMREQFGILAKAESGAKSKVFGALASGAATGVARALAKPLRGQGAIASLLSDTISPTQIHAGYANNVVPARGTAMLDCRLLPDTKPNDFAAWLRKVGDGKDIAIEVKGQTGGQVSEKGPLYEHLAAASRSLPGNPVVSPSLSPGITDVRFFRARGAKGYGWVPLVLPPELLATVHGHDERVPVDDFERAVESMTDLVGRAAGA